MLVYTGIDLCMVNLDAVYCKLGPSDSKFVAFIEETLDLCMVNLDAVYGKLGPAGMAGAPYVVQYVYE